MSLKEAFHKTGSFIKEVVITIKDEAIRFIKGVYQHFESVSLLTLASIGATALLAEIPFYVSLPMWVEAPMVIPVVAVFLVIGLTRLAEYRADRRAKKVQPEWQAPTYHDLPLGAPV